MKTDIITPNYTYYMIVQLILRYEHSMTLILHKYMSKMHSKPLPTKVV